MNSAAAAAAILLIVEVMLNVVAAAAAAAPCHLYSSVTYGYRRLAVHCALVSLINDKLYCLDITSGGLS